MQTNDHNMSISEAKNAIRESGGGGPKSPDFQSALQTLQAQYSDEDSRYNRATEGLWRTLSTDPPFPSSFFGSSLGTNTSGDKLYTLGRLSRDCFSPTNLVCSVQERFVEIKPVQNMTSKDLKCVPKAVLKDVEHGGDGAHLLTCNVIITFTVEPQSSAFPANAPNRDVHSPIGGRMTTLGYCIADPDQPNRHTYFLSGYRIEPVETDLVEWKRLFTLHPPKHTFLQSVSLLSDKWLLGLVVSNEMKAQDGPMEYAFTRPHGGHGVFFLDTLYVDNSLQIVRAHGGTIFVYLDASGMD